eukprot:CAMPEP_0181298138 /NCGR_PEP_ID=MMETSP1101-20121128/5623_1 /TAXON_ID=46948 /ORGANISM="Rhodomonas abbreviata, Strain Caron Lab Isolate" /LENGTH=539 /DNA_ID=CAMNT_0023403141 /DNA_START=99 /DNA_END=1718 /DNA_ORIENTATION=+
MSALEDGPATRVKLTIKCDQIADKDWFSKSDPMCIVRTKENKDGSWTEVGRTEWIKNNQCPEFTTKIEMKYVFEIKQYLEFVIVDIDDPKDLAKSQQLGKLETTLSKIVSSRGGTLTENLTGSKEGGKYGTITVMAEELKGRATDLFLANMKGINLANKDGMFGKSDPFMVFKKKRRDGSFEEIHKTETIDNNLNPVWKPISIRMVDLCNGDLDCVIKLEVWDEDSMSANDEIGWVDTTVRQLLTKQPLKLNDHKAGRNMECGSVGIDKINVVRTPTFMDYIVSGCEITVSVAIDFTMSNREPLEPNSLHFMSESWNQYQEAMIRVGEVLIEYDHDKKIAAFGYGAILPGQTKASHCFALNGNPADVDVDGIQGLLDSYAACLKNVKLYGPTNFAEVIEHSTMMAREQRKEHYHVLLIITDGDITDLQETIKAIVKASSEPMSIIIVGVGDEDFEMMEALDADKQALVDEEGTAAKRDIVQFVDFRSVKNDAKQLTYKVLGELPYQLLAYYCSKGQAPHCWKASDPYVLPPGNWAAAKH